jgi:biopolymer transport protein ExbD
MMNRKHKHEEELEFQIAPMVDVLLVLLVFFITITSASQLKSDKSLALPVAKYGIEKKKSTDRAAVILNVRAKDSGGNYIKDAGGNLAGNVTLDNIQYPNLDTLVPVLEPIYKKNNNLRAVIRADKDILAAYIQKVMTACANAGIQDITFAVLNKGDDV